MFYHHLFLSKEMVMKYDVIFAPLSQKQGITIGLMFKLCVAIFVFLTGYGYCKKGDNLKGYFKKTIYRILKLMFQFWFIYILFFIIGLFTGQCKIYLGDSTLETIKNGIIDFCGLSHFFGTPRMNLAWWYMSLALLFIVITPILVFLNKNKIASIVITIAIVSILLVDERALGSTIYYLLSLEFGVICAKYSLFEKGSQLFSDKKCLDIFIASALIIFLFFVRTKWIYLFACDALIAMCICYIVYRITTIIKNERIVFFIGKHSTNAFLIHTFIYYIYLSDLIYFPRYFLAIWILLLLVTLLISISLERIKTIIKYNQFCTHILQKIH